MVLSESKNCPYGQNFQYISNEASCVRCLVAVASVSHLNISFEGLMLFNAVEVKVLHNIVIKELLKKKAQAIFSMLLAFQLNSTLKKNFHTLSAMCFSVSYKLLGQILASRVSNTTLANVLFSNLAVQRGASNKFC